MLRPATAIYKVSGGWLEAGTQRYENMIPVPLEYHGQVRLRLELTNAESVEVDGEGLSIRLAGEPEILEDLPPEWAPGGDAV